MRGTRTTNSRVPSPEPCSGDVWSQCDAAGQRELRRIVNRLRFLNPEDAKRIAPRLWRALTENLDGEAPTKFIDFIVQMALLGMSSQEEPQSVRRVLRSGSGRVKSGSRLELGKQWYGLVSCRVAR